MKKTIERFITGIIIQMFIFLMMGANYMVFAYPNHQIAGMLITGIFFIVIETIYIYTISLDS